MTLPSQADLERLFADEQVAGEVHAAEVVASWPTLRILEFLSSAEDSSTGEIARGVNMDMAEVRDHLDELHSLGVISKRDEQWHLAVRRIRLDIDATDGLSISHTFDPDEQPGTEDTTEDGAVAWWRRLFPWS